MNEINDDKDSAGTQGSITEFFNSWYYFSKQTTHIIYIPSCFHESSCRTRYSVVFSVSLVFSQTLS